MPDNPSILALAFLAASTFAQQPQPAITRHHIPSTPALDIAVKADPVDYSFATAGAEITLHVEFLPAFAGTPLSLYSGGKALPVFASAFAADSRLERFVGAAAIVSYSVRNKKGKPMPGAVREKVDLLGQSDDIPPRETFHKTVKLVRGVASDVQLFGYDETSVPAENRLSVREASRTSWRKFRQQLFLNESSEPFAVVEWTHTIQGIRLDVAHEGDQ